MLTRLIIVAVKIPNASRSATIIMIKSSEATSTSATSVCSNLASLRDLHEGINDLMQLSSIQQALYNEQGKLWINELLEGSLRLVDLCGFSREILCLTKESVQELESSIRRNRSETGDINAYVASRKKIIKNVNDCIKNLKSFNKNSAQFLENDNDDLKAIATMLTEMEGLDLSVLKSVMTLVSMEKGSSKQRSWSLLSKFVQTNRVHSEEVDKEIGVEDLCHFNIQKSPKQDILKKLKASETTIQEIEEGLESFFRSLIKTRVSLLNKKMANFHSRSNSLPSTSHPIINYVEDRLCRIKSSEATSTSTSSNSICSNLASLIDLHEGINNLMQMPSVQQALSNEQGEHWMNELLEGSMKLVDLCGFSKDVVYLTKESIQELESSIRRNRGEAEIADHDINLYMVSRKNIVKKVNKCIKNLKSFNKNSTTLLGKECDDLKAIATLLKETEGLDLSVLNSVLALVSMEKGRSKQRSWSLLSKFVQTNRVHSEEVDQEIGVEEFCCLNLKNSPKLNILNKLKSSETKIQELGDGLESFFRSLVKTRVSLLNVLSH
ncbi:hypothetical protein ACJIZ3_002786 [Penstemon smallii]|uniref:Uncharacterized protein n=1 Tax=Penstemon smallii TaxID=265156 RepID=A0ABD3UA76_9LAMI